MPSSSELVQGAEISSGLAELTNATKYLGISKNYPNLEKPSL